MKTILYILAAILILFGVLMVVGATDPVRGQTCWIPVGAVIVVVGLVMIYFTGRKQAQEKAAQQNVTLQINVPGNVNLEKMKCKSCGGELRPENIKVDPAGAPVVTCPYCHTTYTMTEEPKW